MPNDPKHILTRLRGAVLWQIALLAVLLLLGMVGAATMGYLKVPFFDTLKIILAKTAGRPQWSAGIKELFKVVIWDVRLPRIITSAVVGGGLAVSGVVFQGILLNPLADPYTLGVSAGAAFGASLAILLNLSLMGTYSIPVFAFLGAVATLAVVLYLSAGSGNDGFSATNLILAGIIVAAILSAGISLLKYIADEQVAVIIFWLMGSFASKTWADVFVVSVFSGVGLGLCLYFARDLNLLALGRRSAATLGVDTRRVPLILLVCASLVAAAAVAVAGIIGFVGLLVPHMMRGVCGPDNRRLIPVSFLAGAILLLAADTLTRAVLPTEIPIGVLTALVGGPFFCYVFRQRQMRQGRS